MQSICSPRVLCLSTEKVEGAQHLSADYSEDALVEQPAIALFNQLG